MDDSADTEEDLNGLAKGLAETVAPTPIWASYDDAVPRAARAEAVAAVDRLRGSGGFMGRDRGIMTTYRTVSPISLVSIG